MQFNSLYAVTLNDLQEHISKLRLNANRVDESNPQNEQAKLSYKGWVSTTAYILTKIEKSAHNISLFEANRYLHEIDEHLKTLEYRKENHPIHQAKKETLTKVRKLLNDAIDIKKNTIIHRVNVLRDTIEKHQHQFTEEEQNYFEQYIKNIELHNPNEKYSTLANFIYLIKLLIQRIITFFKKLFRITSDIQHEEKTQHVVTKLMDFLEQNLSNDCVGFIAKIKIFINSHSQIPEVALIQQKYHSLLKRTEFQPEQNHNLCNELNRLTLELKPYASDSFALEQDLETIKKDNTFIVKENVRRKKLDLFSTLLQEQEIKESSAHIRSNNLIKHYINSYEDASVPENELQGAFPDIIRCIKEAKHLICIEGWELNLHLDYLKPGLRSLVEHEKSHNSTLGRLLIEQALKYPNIVIAIKVWAQLWDGSLTYHHDSIKYLNDIAREYGLKNGLKDLPNIQLRAVNHVRITNSYHAKGIIIDEECNIKDSSSKERKLVAFIGGMDLSKCRMDDIPHRNQLNQSGLIFEGLYKGVKGWQDRAHKYVGPVVEDFVRKHFFPAWKRSNTGILSFFNKSTTDNNYHFLKRFKKNLEHTRLVDYSEVDMESTIWNSQLIQSSMGIIPSISFWSPYVAESSIAAAYVDAIGQANKCIELETQYFIGGPGIHGNPEHAKFNPIPEAIVNRIIDRHKAQESFHVFITLPMLPNANVDPGSMEMDSIRALQWLTMKWVMNEIEKNTGRPFWHYITFNFLAQWQGKSSEYDALLANPNTTREQLLAASNRWFIYVHSKLMVVDDELMICGSANVNERSMRGNNGDGEVAIISRPAAGYEKECKAQIYEQRRKYYTVIFGPELNHDDCIQNPQNYYLQRQKLGMKNLEHFYENTVSMDQIEGATPYLIWPLIYSDELEQVGKYQESYSRLPDTPLKDNEPWHTEHFPTILRAMAGLGLRIFS